MRLLRPGLRLLFHRAPGSRVCLAHQRLTVAIEMLKRSDSFWIVHLTVVMSVSEPNL